MIATEGMFPSRKYNLFLKENFADCYFKVTKLNVWKAIASWIAQTIAKELGDLRVLSFQTQSLEPFSTKQKQTNKYEKQKLP